MAYDTLLATLGLLSLASASTPTTYNPTAVRAGVAIEPAALPSTPTPGSLAVDSDDGNNLKWWNGSAWQTAGGGSGSPAGSNTQIQFNDSGSFGASSNLTWDGSVLSLVGGFEINAAGTAKGSLSVFSGSWATTKLDSRGPTASEYGYVELSTTRGDGGAVQVIMRGNENHTEFSVPAYFFPNTSLAGVVIGAGDLPLAPDVGSIIIDSNDGNALKWWNGTSWQSAGGGGGGGGPAGSNTELQFNDAGSFGASPNLWWDGSLHVQTNVSLMSVTGLPATLSFYQPSLVDYASININETTNELEFRASNATILLLSLPTSTSGFVQSYCDVALSSDKAYYIGDPNTDDSWRMIIVGTDLAFQRRELGVWNTKQTIFA